MIKQIKDTYHPGIGPDTLVREIGMGIYPSKAALEGLPRATVVRPDVLAAMTACFAGTSERALMEQASSGMGYVSYELSQEAKR
jgi:hypothetical protein